MEIQEAVKRLKPELQKRSLYLVWVPTPEKLGKSGNVIFGAEQSPKSKVKPLIAGIGPGGSEESYGNSSEVALMEREAGFHKALEAAGIPMKLASSSHIRVGRGKIWPTFIACFTEEVIKKL